jgi:hypothetical protein
MFYGNNELPSFDNLIDMKTIFACLIFIINVAVYAQSRDPRSKDQANVFWNGTYPLYSLTSDILISPNNLGEYIFWGTTNEDPSPKEYKLLKGQMNTIYKFIDYQECVNFCNEVRKSKGMQLLQVNTEVYTVQIENCESARNDYLNKNPDVKKAGIDPWTHYNYYGKNEGRVWPKCNQKSTDLTNQFVIPNSVLEISSALDQINDTLEKISYLNNLISHVKNKSERTDWDISMYQASFNYKLFYILPNKYNDPRISQDEWISLNDFLNLLGEQAYMSEDSKDMRGCFLYFNILVKQKLGNNSVDIKWPKMVVNEFTENNFPYGGGFYNECRRVINDSKSLPPRTCSYKFSKPTLTVTWIDNRKKCCNPYCNEWSSYSNVKEDNLKNAELQYLNDALDAHFLEVNADNNHRALDYIALSEFKTKNYYNDQILGDFSKLFAAFDVMSGALSSTMLSSMSVLTNETVQEKIIRLKSKKKSLSLYRTTKYCSKSCEQLVDDMGYKCD